MTGRKGSRKDSRKDNGREFDIILYGATGFVGKLTAEYLAEAAPPARIALAGRSPEKLTAVRSALGEAAKSWPILSADAAKPSTLEAMAASTRVVVTTVGPYSKYGLPLVETSVDVLRVNTNLTIVSPTDVSSSRLQRPDQGPQQSSFPLTVVANNRGPLSMLDFDFYISSHDVIGIANRQFLHPHGWTLTRCDNWSADRCRR